MIVRKFASFALTAYLLAALSYFVAGSAWALSLGIATVQSSLGQGLRAEVDVSTAADAEADSLTVEIASVQAYAAGNLDFNPALQDLKVSLQRRAGGNLVIRITGDRPVNEPVLQVLLDVRWSTGKMVRSFTLFIDPPAPEKTKTESGSIIGATPAAVLVPEKIPPIAPSAASETTTPKAQAAASAPTAESQASGNAATTQRSIVIQKGDTARQIATRLRTENRTAEQLMLALLQANPDAFVAQNINRLKAGATLKLEPLPDPQSLSTDAAAREVARQAATYAAWRRGVTALNSGPADARPIKNDEGRSTNKKVGPAPETSKTPVSKDELKLGAAKEKDKAEAEKLAADMQAKEDSERKAELAKNIEALKEAAAKTSEAAGSGSATATASEKPAEATPAPGPAVAAKVPEPVSDTSFDGVLQNLQSLDTMTLAGTAAAVVLLVAWFLVRRRASPAADSDDQASEPADTQAVGEEQPNLGSREPSLSPGFEASALATQDPAPAPSPPSVLFADSQLKPSDNLDAVAEADVYLAYGRDAQAEEILREALGVTPNKVELHQKLLDIFVLRGDADGFAQIAQTMSTYVDSQGPQWLKVCELGALLDGNNPLYHNHANPDSLASGASLSSGARPLPLGFPAGLDLNLAKPADKAAGPAGQDFRPSTQAQALGFEFSSQNLVLTPEGSTPLDTAQPWSVQAGDEGSRLLDQKIELAKEFIGVSDFAGARILLNEVIERAQGNQLEQAKQLLAQIA